MYWDDWNKKAVFVADKDNGAGIQQVLGDMAGVMDLKVFGASHRIGKNKCSDKPCSHLCVPMPSNDKYKGFKCLCPDGKQNLNKKS